MDDIVLYCKSYRNDLERCKKLFESIERYNMDKIPVYLSVPLNDVFLFRKNISKNIILLSDELIESHIYKNDLNINFTNPNVGWIKQQIIKSNFWKLDLCKNYVCIDSDSYFIKPFYKTNFLYKDDIPFTIIHEQKELFSWMVENNFFHYNFIQEEYKKVRLKIMNFFDRCNKNFYDFGPVPVIWSCKVWKDLEENILKQRNLCFSQLIEYADSEFCWYGESLLKYDSIPIFPKEPLFKCFHYKEQYEQYLKIGMNDEKILKNYIGIVTQSNWNN